MGTLTNALKALFTKSNITSDSSRAVPILNSAKEVEGSMTLANLASVLGAANTRARVFNGRVTETSSGKLENLTTGIVYCANPGNLDDAPSGFAEGPTVFIYLGLSGTPRGIQIGFNCSNSSVMKIAMRGQLYSGWSAWKSITLT